jgi:hypothetical protein
MVCYTSKRNSPVTFKDLQKLVHSQSGPERSHLLQKLKDKPFWIWNQKQHRQEDIQTKGDCCFNHIIGLPIKDKVVKPLFDYEKQLYDSLLIQDFYNPLQHTFKLKHLWVKKATGLGVTEFFLRFMAWLCLRNNDYRGSQMCLTRRFPKCGSSLCLQFISTLDRHLVQFIHNSIRP